MAPLDLQEHSGMVLSSPGAPLDSPSLSLRSCLKKSNSKLMEEGKTRTPVSTKRQRAKIHFGRNSSDPLNVEIQKIPHYSELSQEVTDSIWFTDREIRSMAQEAQDTVISMAQGIPLADDNAEFTSRGLEYMTPSGFDITSSNVEAVHLVLEEQTRQKAEHDFAGTLDMELCAAIVASISRHRMRIAHLAGMKDARLVYGDGNFKVDRSIATNGRGRRSRSRSADNRREQRRGLTSSSSSDALAEKTRRRRGSRGALNRETRERPASRRSAPANPQDMTDATFGVPNKPTKARSSVA